MTNNKPAGGAAPFDLALHEHLIALGYEHERMPSGGGDDGDGETGPMPWHCPAADQYTSPDEVVYLDANGLAVREGPQPDLDVVQSLTAFEAHLGNNDKIGAGYYLLEYIRENNHAGWDGYTPAQLAAVAFFFEDVMRYRAAAEDTQ